MIRFVKNFKIYILSILFFIISLNAIANDDLNSKKNDKDELDTYVLLQLFGSVLSRIENNYVEEFSHEEIIESAISGMLSSLDPHSG